MHAEIQPQDLSTPVISSVSQGSGEYFSRIGVRTPAKSFYTPAATSTGSNAAPAPIATSNQTWFSTRLDLPPTANFRARLANSR
ncbi:hypothetical protein ACFX13_026165 [Malus domestica]